MAKVKNNTGQRAVFNYKSATGVVSAVSFEPGTNTVHPDVLKGLRDQSAFKQAEEDGQVEVIDDKSKAGNSNTTGEVDGQQVNKLDPHNPPGGSVSDDNNDETNNPAPGLQDDEAKKAEEAKASKKGKSN